MKKNPQILFVVLILSIMIFDQIKSTIFADDFILKLAPDDTLAYLNIPERPENAMGGTAFSEHVTGWSIENREKAVVQEILSGNVPSFSRKLRPLIIHETIKANDYELIFFTVCDYMAIGSDDDYLYIPMTPSTAQYVANQLACTLPTKKLVDIIYAQAEIKLRPQPIPPSDKMTTVPVFRQHTDSIKQQISELGVNRSSDYIFGGHKKDVIISNKIYSPDRNYDRVVIYGWHLSENNPIQPVYNGHIAQYADYSHGIRFISNIAFINGDSAQITGILQDPNLAGLLSSEGVIAKPYYPESDLFTSMDRRSDIFPIDVKLWQNYPNPFNATTTINYRLPVFSTVDLSIFNLTGEKLITLVSQEQPAGNYQVEWDAMAFSSGIYIYKIKAGLYEKSRKMVLVK